jgi:hypothetical protein
VEKVCVCVCADYYAAHRRSRSELDLPVSVEQSVHDGPLLDEHSSGQLDRDGKFMGQGWEVWLLIQLNLFFPTVKAFVAVLNIYSHLYNNGEVDGIPLLIDLTWNCNKRSMAGHHLKMSNLAP